MSATKKVSNDAHGMQMHAGYENSRVRRVTDTDTRTASSHTNLTSTHYTRVTV